MLDGLLRFRSPLLAESLLLSFPTGTKMFQFPAFPLSWQSSTAGLPHSEIPGSLFTYNSPRLIVVRHVLRRLLVPRHSPYALCSLTLLQYDPLFKDLLRDPSRSLKTERKLPYPKRFPSSRFVRSFLEFLPRKEVIHPHVPVGIPCYDLTPITGPALDGSLLTVRPPASGITNSFGLTGGVYKTRERIHRGLLTHDY